MLKTGLQKGYRNNLIHCPRLQTFSLQVSNFSGIKMHVFPYPTLNEKCCVIICWNRIALQCTLHSRLNTQEKLLSDVCPERSIYFLLRKLYVQFLVQNHQWKQLIKGSNRFLAHANLTSSWKNTLFMFWECNILPEISRFFKEYFTFYLGMVYQTQHKLFHEVCVLPPAIP